MNWRRLVNETKSLVRSGIPKHPTALFLIIGILLVPFTVQAVAQQQNTPDKYLQADVPTEVYNNQGEFKFTVWLDPKYVKQDEVVHIYFQQDPSLTFDPPDFDLKGTQHVGVKAKKTGTDKLVRVIANSDRAAWLSIDRTVNFGFVGEMKADSPGEIKSGQIKSVVWHFVDEQGKKTTLKAPTMLRVIGSNMRARQVGTNEWKNPLEVWLDPGANATPLIEVSPESVTGGQGRLQAAVLIGGQYVLMTGEDLQFPTPPPDWLIFVMAIVGGLIHAAYELVTALLRSSTEGTHITGKAIIGVLSGVIAVLFADKVGISIDRTSLTGFVALGFLVAYIGVDTLLNRAAGKRAPETAK